MEAIISSTIAVGNFIHSGEIYEHRIDLVIPDVTEAGSENGNLKEC